MSDNLIFFMPFGPCDPASVDPLLIVAVRLSRSRDRAEKIAAATPGAGSALQLAFAPGEANAQLHDFLRLAAKCDRDPAQKLEWRARDGHVFTLGNIGAPLPGDTPTVC